MMEEEIICKKVAYINTVNHNLGQVDEKILEKFKE